ncbi:hypothetical protein [Hymenobacter lapidiphilus]|uniref:DUF1795 domain-containing protein n=1 Tax=Hymenobacter lapidiphilus TaxID=2608003 RepID=A0A7Y7PNX0_9BACT|nr:hypothetical protein [Hymenobacter lapidiphilus]NVO31299.1 hypothetical protein [Hymenobacter lapidiphilus]
MNSVSRFFRFVPLLGLLFGLLAFAGPGLKKTTVAKNLTMGVPDGFAPLPDEGIAAKYPAQRRPLAVFASPNGQVGLSVSQKPTNFSNRDYGMLLKIYKASIQNMYGKVQFLREDIHTINKRDFVVLEFVSTVADNRRGGGNLAAIRKYQLVQYAIEGEQLYVFTFDAPANEQAKWQPVAQAAMESIVMK